MDVYIWESFELVFSGYFGKFGDYGFFVIDVFFNEFNGFVIGNGVIDINVVVVVEKLIVDNFLVFV